MCILISGKRGRTYNLTHFMEKKNGTFRKNPEYELVARTSADGIEISDEYAAAAIRSCRDRISYLSRKDVENDDTALALSMEWERLARFYVMTGRRKDADHAYRMAIRSCDNGYMYDHGDSFGISVFLRRRKAALAEDLAEVAKSE